MTLPLIHLPLNLTHRGLSAYWSVASTFEVMVFVLDLRNVALLVFRFGLKKV